MIHHDTILSALAEIEAQRPADVFARRRGVVVAWNFGWGLAVAFRADGDRPRVEGWNANGRFHVAPVPVELARRVRAVLDRE